MSDVYLIAVLVVFFALAIALVHVLSRMIDRDTDPDRLEDEPPDPGLAPPAGLDGLDGRGGPR